MDFTPRSLERGGSASSQDGEASAGAEMERSKAEGRRILVIEDPIPNSSNEIRVKPDES